MKETLLKSFGMTILAAVVGAGLGIFVWRILASIALPASYHYIFSNEEVSFLKEGMGSFNFFLHTGTGLIFGTAAIVSAIAYFIIFLRSLNPQFGFRWFRTRAGAFKMVLVIVLLLIGGCMISYSIYIQEQIGFPELTFLAVIAILSGAIWAIVSKTGFGSETPKPRGVIISFLTGAIAVVVWGVFVYLFSHFYFNWLLKLVAEVWGGWGEVTTRGFLILLYGMTASFACAFAIGGGLALVLNPAKVNLKIRFHFLIIPLILIIASSIFLLAFRSNAVSKYDMDKRTLAEACGIPESTTDTMTVVFFGSKGGVPTAGIENWPFSVSPMSFMGAGKVDVSIASLKKIEEYSRSHLNQTLFTRAARDALWRGYMLNWMVRKATAYQFVATRDYLITRMLFLSRLKNVPVTKEAVSYADHFSNETNYTIGKKGARPLALIYNHIGMPDKAKYWALRSDEPDEIEISEHPLVTNGLISGRIILNEKPFRGRVALFNTEEEEVSAISGFVRFTNIVDATDTENGLFSFENIGEGKYFLAVMVKTEKEPPEIEVKHNPGIVSISSKAPKADLGMINIWIK